MRLNGLTVLLTGALGSLGRAQARLLAAEGAHVWLLDREDEAAAAALLEGCPGARYLRQDLGDLALTQARLRDEIAAHGPVDILINNAALIINRPFEEFSLAEYDEQLRVNAAAGFALAQVVAPGMKAKGWGKIVNFCSLTLNGRWDGYVPYVVSKGAMLGLTKTLARELGPHGVRVNAVSPGAVVSEAEERVFGDKLQEYNDWILTNQSLKVRIQPEDIANLVLFLVCKDSDAISGQNIGIDGGW